MNWITLIWHPGEFIWLTYFPIYDIYLYTVIEWGFLYLIFNYQNVFKLGQVISK